MIPALIDTELRNACNERERDRVVKYNVRLLKLNSVEMMEGRIWELEKGLNIFK
jgi:hypothetical protein